MSPRNYKVLFSGEIFESAKEPKTKVRFDMRLKCRKLNVKNRKRDGKTAIRNAKQARRKDGRRREEGAASGGDAQRATRSGGDA